jgi:hypothetical protein
MIRDGFAYSLPALVVAVVLLLVYFALHH